MNSVYMIKFMWSTDDDSGCEIELYKNYDDAVKRFNEMTENEKDPDFSWVADAFDDGRITSLTTTRELTICIGP